MALEHDRRRRPPETSPAHTPAPAAHTCHTRPRPEGPVEAYITRIDAARLDGAQLLGIGAEIFVDRALSARQRQMLIARAAMSNRPGNPREHTHCRRDMADRCAFCLKGPGPGLAAAGGRWFDDDAFTWRDRGGRTIAPVPPDEWRFVRTGPVAVGDPARPPRRCASCAARIAVRAQEHLISAHSRNHRAGRSPGANCAAAVDAGDSADARRLPRQLALDLGPLVARRARTRGD